MIELPRARFGAAYCLTFPFLSPLPDGAIVTAEVVSDAEFNGNLANLISIPNNCGINYQAPAQTTCSIIASNAPGVLPDLFEFSFTPPQFPGTYLFTFKVAAGNSVVYHLPMFLIEVDPVPEPLGFLTLSFNGNPTPDPVELNPNSIFELAIETTAGYGELAWDISINTASERDRGDGDYFIRPPTVRFLNDKTIYTWRISLASLTPPQLGGQDTIFLQPYNKCAGPNQTFGWETSLLINVPPARLIPTQDYTDNILPTGRLGVNYRNNNVFFRLVPEGADFTGYDNWELLEKDEPVQNGSFPQLFGANTQKQIEGVPEYGADYFPLRMQASHASNPDLAPIISDTFTITICQGNFDEVPSAYELIDLTKVLPQGVTWSKADKISDSGFVTGAYVGLDNKRTYVIWYQNSNLEWQYAELPLPEDVANDVLLDLAVNDSGEVTGTSTKTFIPGRFPNRSYGVYWRPSQQVRGAWELVREIDDNLFLKDINNRQESLVTQAAATSFDSASGVITNHPESFLFEEVDDKFIPLPENTGAFALNDQGNMAGNLSFTQKFEFPRDVARFSLLKKPVFINRSNLKVEELPIRSPFNPLLNTVYTATDINSQNRVIGNVQVRLTGNRVRSEQALLWERLDGNWEIIDLQLPARWADKSFASGINDLSQVVGHQVKDGVTRPFLYDHRLRNLLHDPGNRTNNQAKDQWLFFLDELVDSTLNFRQFAATDINNAGNVVGTIDGKAILLQPKAAYNFRILDHTPVKINNRSQVILKNVVWSPTPASFRSIQYSLWEECLGDLGVPAHDINDDMVAVGFLSAFRRSVANNEEIWEKLDLPRPGNLHGMLAYTLNGFTPSRLALNGISNANIIGGEMMFRNPNNLEIKYGGIYWAPFGGGSLNIPTNFAKAAVVRHPIIDFNTGGEGITGFSQNDRLMALPTFDSLGVFDVLRKEFSVVDHRHPNRENDHEIKQINAAGTIVGRIHGACGYSDSEVRGFIAVPPYAPNLNVREFCDFLPSGINSQGWVVGTKQDTAYLFIPDFPGSLNGQFIDLNSFLSEEDRQLWYLVTCRGLNDNQEFVGTAKSKNDGGIDIKFTGVMMKITSID